MIRVLVADDHAGFRSGVTTMLGSMTDVEVVGEAATGEEAVLRVQATQPSVVLMDLAMPGQGGLEATARLTRDVPHVAVLVLTMSADDNAVTAAMQAGARGYLVKGAPREEVEHALHTVADGGVVVGAALAHRVAALFGNVAMTEPDGMSELTAREREVLDLMAQGMSNLEIARRLVLSPKTVRNVVSAIFRKLRTSDRVRVVLRARDVGLGADRPSRDSHAANGTAASGAPDSADPTLRE